MPVARVSIEDLLSKDDREVANGAFMLLVKASQAVGAVASREPERVVVLTWEAHGLIGNGGFECLYESELPDEDPGLENTIRAFRTLGLVEVAQAIQGTLSWFPNGKIPSDPSKAVRSIPKADRNRAYDATGDGRKALPQRLAAYVRAHRREIEDILTDYEAKRRSLEGAKLVPDSSWDIGDQPLKAVIPEFLLRLYSLPPGAILVLVANHPGDALVPESKREGKVDITTEDVLRQFCGNAGHVVVKVDPPHYWIRRRGE